MRLEDLQLLYRVWMRGVGARGSQRDPAVAQRIEDFRRESREGETLLYVTLGDAEATRAVGDALGVARHAVVGVGLDDRRECFDLVGRVHGDLL